MKIHLENTGIRGTGSKAAESKQRIMAGLKFHWIIPALAAGILVAGCADYRGGLVLDPVGPAPGAAAPADGAVGSLVVYSAYETIPDLSAVNSGSTDDHRQYFGYKILSPDGQPFKSVNNNAGTVELHPQQVELPAGRYLVVAQANGYGRVTVPVTIIGRQNTILHLEGGGFWPNEFGFNHTNTVRLPNGEIVGWRANAEQAPTP
jgi:hypothetical protein